MQKIKLNICGIEFTINTEKTSEEAYQDAAAIEAAIKSLRTDNHRVSTTLASVITALGYYDKMQTALKSAQHANSQIDAFKSETEKMRLENEQMKEELRLVRSQLKKSNTKSDTSPPIPKQFKFTTVKSSGKYIKPTLDDIIPEQDNLQTFFEQKPED